MEVKNAFYYSDIERVLDEQLELASACLDELLLCDTLSNDKIRMASAERITIKKLKTIFKQEMEQ